MEIDLKNIMDPDDCENFKETVSKFGVTTVCSEEDSETADIVLPATAECESIINRLTSRGVVAVCSDEDDTDANNAK